MKNIANLILREIIKESKFTHYEVADLLGMSEATFGRKLRKELTEEEKNKIIKVIEDNK